MFSTVLFPIDQSREALETAGKALELAKSHGSRMGLLSVVQPERPEMHGTKRPEGESETPCDHTLVPERPAPARPVEAVLHED